MHSSLWLATICPCHLTSHSLPLLPAQGAPRSSHPSWAGAPGTGRQPVPAPTVSIPAGTREETKPREADKRTPRPLCQAAGLVLLAGTRGTAEPRLAEGTSLGCPPTAPQLFLWGQKPSHLLPFLFLLLLPLPPSTSPTAWGPCASSPLSPPQPCSYFRERQEVFLVLPAPRRSSEPLSHSSAGARETAAALADISCIIKLNPSRGPDLSHQLSKKGKEQSQRARD